MIEHKTIIVVADWRRALIAIKRDILDAEPVVALSRIDALLVSLAVSLPVIQSGNGFQVALQVALPEKPPSDKG